MSTTQDASSGRPSAEQTPAAEPEQSPEAGAGETSGSGGPDDGSGRSAAERMRDGAMARTAQGRDLAARKARALRGTTAGLASGSAAGATARGRGTGAPPRAGTPPRTAPPRSGRAGDPRQAAPPRRGARRVRLAVQRIDPWSVLKISFLVSVALGIAGVVMVAVLWTVLSGMNVFSTLNDFLAQVTSGETGDPSIDLRDYLGFSRVIPITAGLGVVNVFLLMALATLTAFLYNICAALVGGAQVTLSDE